MKRRLTIYLSDELLFKIKLLALQRGVSVSQLVESILNEYIEHTKKPHRPRNSNSSAPSGGFY
ncbi:MAG: CopG family transcriptional regulator [Archaeoglobaceae archaeon]